jgi:Ca2+-binding EF-hand superfamily protein
LERIEFDIEAKLENVSPEARNFCLACLKVVPEERMPLAEAMVHPWFKKMDVQEMGRQKIRHSFADVKRSVVPTNKNFLKRACLVRLSILWTRWTVLPSPAVFSFVFVQIVAKHVDEDLLDEHQQIFDEIDVDRNGYITHEEFFQALKVNSKVTDDLISDFLDLDLDRSGTISFNEFVAAVLLYTDRIDDNTLIKTFHHMDPSGTGFISVSDLCHVMEDVTADEAREMLYEAIGHREMAEPTLTQKQFMNAFRTKNKSTFNTWLSRIVNG